MSNTYRAEQEAKPIVVTDASGKVVTLASMFFDILNLCRSIQARWDLTLVSTASELPVVCLNEEAGKRIDECAEALFASLGGLDHVTCALFSEIAKAAVESNHTLGVTESSLLNKWRADFRSWRKAAHELIDALSFAHKVEFRTVIDKPGWKPPEPRPSGAQLLAAQLAQKLLSLQASLPVLDNQLRRYAPSLLIEVALPTETP